MILVVVLTQRLALPVGNEQVPLAAPVVLVLLCSGLVTRTIDVDTIKLRLYCVATALLVLLTGVAYARGYAPSLPSLLFIVFLYPLAVVSLAPGRHDVDAALDVFVRVMVVAAVVGLLQTAVQYLGITYRDWLAEVVPPDFLLRGYNTGDPVAWGVALYRANGAVFLEPSLYAGFLAIAILVVLRRGLGAVSATVMTAALIPPLAGNGFAVLAPGLLVLAVVSGWRVLRLMVVPAALAVVLATMTPLGALLLGRSTEVSSTGTSSSLRLVEPYTLIIPAWASDWLTVLVGRGPGSTSDLLEREGAATTGLLTPIVPKLLYEYGVLGAIAFLVFVLYVLWAPWTRMPWVPGLLVSYVFLNAALLQATLALSTILFVSVLRPKDDAAPVTVGPR